MDTGTRGVGRSSMRTAEMRALARSASLRKSISPEFTSPRGASGIGLAARTGGGTGAEGAGRTRTGTGNVGTSRVGTGLN